MATAYQMLTLSQIIPQSIVPCTSHTIHIAKRNLFLDSQDVPNRSSVGCQILECN